MCCNNSLHFFWFKAFHQVSENSRFAPIHRVERSGSHSLIHFIPTVLDGVEVRALCSQVKLFYTTMGKPFFMNLAWCMGTGMGLPQTVATKSEGHYSLKYYFM